MDPVRLKYKIENKPMGGSSMIQLSLLYVHFIEPKFDNQSAAAVLAF